MNNAAMPRSEQNLHDSFTPATPLQASTLLLLRDSGSRLQVLMTRRAPRASFAANAWVFPGGGIEAQDHAPAMHALADGRPVQMQESTRLTAALAAIRETFEELGVLLARHADGRWADALDIAAIKRGAPFAPQIAARGLRLAADALWLFGHFTAERSRPRRFAVPFYVARMPQGQVPVADNIEQFEPTWLSPQEALERHAAGQFFMIYPTVRTLERLAQFEDVNAVLAAVADEKLLWVSIPREGVVHGKLHLYMEHEAPYGELALRCPEGQSAPTLDWQSEQPVPLLKNVSRLTAPNGGMMTGPGTNSYVVGDANTGYVVIDPGPHDIAHIERLWQATGGDVRAIVCTHSHPDHSPGAAPLADLVVARGKSRPPIYGLPSKATSRADSRFAPDRLLEDGALLPLTGKGATHTLQAIHTPGHAANHVCLLLQEDGLLFSGDHILNGSTTVIDPPDGNMADYLASLDKLYALCGDWKVEFILPAHGHVLGEARHAIAQLKAHRLAREAKVATAMQALPQGSVQEWVRQVYGDVPEHLWPIAERSLLAHVEHLRQR